MESLQHEYDFSLYAVRGLADGEVGASLNQQLQAMNIPVFAGPRIPMRFGGMLTGAIGFARCVRRFKPDLIHLHTEIPEASYATMVAAFPKMKTIPLVRTIHNAVIWKSWPGLGRACDRKMSDAYIAGVSNDAVGAFLSLRESSGAASSALPPTTIYNGVRSPKTIHSAGKPVASVIRMVYAGRLEPEKGTDLLPEILARTELPPGHSAHLTIIGSGRHELALRWLQRHSPAGWTIDVSPPTANFSEQLASHDIALVPSRHEGLSLVAIEAMLASIQIVATDASGLREALPRNHPWRARAGDAASFAAAIQYACANHERWPAIAETQRAFALDRFSVEKMTSGYRSLYQQALKRSAEFGRTDYAT
jgi:glycosyltransferase involved in cell wall biosynthesis